MDYFDASEELHQSIQNYMDAHDGKPPQRLLIAPGLYHWLVQIRKDESLLAGQNPDTIDFSVFPTEVGPLPLVIDELLSDFEIIPE
jgi:hypothetical protein